MALAAALRHQQARPQAGGVPFMQHPQSTLSRPLHMPSDLQAADRMAQMMASDPRLMMHGPQGVAAYENAKGSGNGKGQRAEGSGNGKGIWNNGKGNSVVDMPDNSKMMERALVERAVEGQAPVR